MLTYRYWPVSSPIPEGWVLASDLKGTHHGVYSVLILQLTPRTNYAITSISQQSGSDETQER
jgi:hypothetical protein